MTLCALADDAGADGSANVPRPLRGLLLDFATPSAPASSAVTYRQQLDWDFFECFQGFYAF